MIFRNLEKSISLSLALTILDVSNRLKVPHDFEKQSLPQQPSTITYPICSFRAMRSPYSMPSRFLTTTLHSTKQPQNYSDIN